MKSQLKKEHREQLKQERQDVKIKMAAYHFLKTSTDGAVICQLCGIKPRVLDGIFRDERGVWLEALRFWQAGYEGERRD